MGMRRAYKEVVEDNLPDWYKNYQRRLNQPHPIWIFRWAQYLKRGFGGMSARDRIIMDNTITAAYSEADRNRHSLELQTAKAGADARVHYRLQQAIQRVVYSDISAEAKVEAIKALTSDPA